jgi:hypothetical protein
MLSNDNDLDHSNAHQQWWAFGFPIRSSITGRGMKALNSNDLGANV